MQKIFHLKSIRYKNHPLIHGFLGIYVYEVKESDGDYHYEVRYDEGQRDPSFWTRLFKRKKAAPVAAEQLGVTPERFFAASPTEAEKLHNPPKSPQPDMT